MSEREHQVPRSLPQGCSEAPVTGVKKPLHLINPSSKSLDRYKRKLDNRRDCAIEFANRLINPILHGSLDKNISDVLEGTDERTQRTYQSLFAEATLLMKDEHFVITTSDHVGGKLTERKKWHMVGGDIFFFVENHRLREPIIRRFEGKFIGIVINPRSKFAKQSGRRYITTLEVENFLNAMINVRDAMQEAKESGSLDEFLTQQQFDEGINWIWLSK